jgi:hypothetical protein
MILRAATSELPGQPKAGAKYRLKRLNTRTHVVEDRKIEPLEAMGMDPLEQKEKDSFGSMRQHKYHLKVLKSYHPDLRSLCEELFEQIEELKDVNNKEDRSQLEMLESIITTQGKGPTTLGEIIEMFLANPMKFEFYIQMLSQFTRRITEGEILETDKETKKSHIEIRVSAFSDASDVFLAIIVQDTTSHDTII